MSAEFWMGIAIGTITALCIILVTVFFASRASERKAEARANSANHLLRERIAISLRQCETIEWAADQLKYWPK